MMTTLIFLQTFLLSSLPSLATGFNNTLSIVETSPKIVVAADTGRTDLTSPDRTNGKVIKERENAKDAYRIKTVVIDAGHGGHDPGCLGSDSREKHLALAISKSLAASMEARFTDLRIIMTRDEDVFVPLHERAAIANRAGADLFISIHCNYMPKSEATHGSETYVMGLHTAEHNLDVAKRENAVILLEDNYEKNYDYDPNSTEGHIMLTMYQNAYLEQSILFAERVEAKISEDAKRRSRGVKQAGFVVLKETAMPSVLIETGFLSNRQEEKYLKTEAGQQQIANAILNAFEEYRILIEGVPATEEPPLATAAPDSGPKADDIPVTQDPFHPAASTGSSSMGTPIEVNPGTAHEPRTKESERPQQQGSNYAAGPEAHRQQPPSVQESTKKIEQQMSPEVQGRAQQPGGSAPRPKPVATSQQIAAASGTASIQFCVQLAASPQPLNTSGPHWQNTGQKIEVVEEQGLYKYQVRAFDSLRDAMNARFQLRSLGFTDAFIVAYKGKERISMDQARLELGE